MGMGMGMVMKKIEGDENGGNEEEDENKKFVWLEE